MNLLGDAVKKMTADAIAVGVYGHLEKMDVMNDGMGGGGVMIVGFILPAAAVWEEGFTSTFSEVRGCW